MVHRCSAPVAERLNDFLAAGQLDWLPKPIEALRIVTKLGPTAAEFIMTNVENLKDQDAFESLVEDPESLVYGSRSLAEAAAARRERRDAWWQIRADRNSMLGMGLGLLAGLVVGLVISRRRTRRAPT
ncbi:MAG TPA: hypothetical protein VHR66_01420 [Gemmataceae bacterium]|nr:hypothetical protein [Gemmataceae bacterium]